MQVWTWTPTTFETCDSIPVTDRGFRYGMAVFESIRVYKGFPLFWEEHVRRLQKACSDRSFCVDASALLAAAEKLRENGRDGFARIYVTAGDGKVTDPAGHCRIFLLMENRERPTQTGYKLATPDEVHQPIFGGLKTANYWPNIDVLQRAVSRGFNEALLFNENAELVSACMGNVFVVKDGHVRTPALACGARDGVIRDWVRQQLPARECSLFLDDVRNADEVFLTNTWIGIMPVTEVEKRSLPSQEVSTRLQTALEQAITAQIH
ncbi:aminotransferase class IV [Verrucomicrobiota bacterium sgz303538]